ncbi:hypothetical protein H7F53_07940 [Novosphingobium piscinae]|uniref:Uncharacterized protein n=2 Tax=Novosphingobium piscinae TaxID=1507448 RepID=A0A7X1FY03_9SPHN|nr:hypothetical protein [Novosphingobium piscinae]
MATRADLPKPGARRVVVVIRVACSDDILLHRGLLQVLGLTGLQCVIVLAMPTPAALALVRHEALREGWGLSAVLTTVADCAALLPLLAGNTTVVCFPQPAPLPADLARALAAGEACDAAPGTWDYGVMAGAAATVADLLCPDLALPDPGALAALAEALRNTDLPSEPGGDQERHDEDSTLLPHVAEVEAWLRASEMELPDIHPGDLITVALIEPDGNQSIAAVQPAVLGAGGQALCLPALPRHARPTPRPMQVCAIGRDQVRAARPVNYSLPATALQPSLLTAYLNRGGGGNPVIQAFADGTGCRLAYAEDHTGELPDVPVVWGVLRGSDKILAQARAQDLHYFYIDHAYFDRGHGHSYRIARNAYEAGPVRKVPDDRLKMLDLEIHPWRKGGRNIVVCPPTEFFAAAHGCEDWLDTTLHRLRVETDRPIIIREKPRQGEPWVPLPQALADAHALVTHSSNVAIEAACLGTPVFVAPTSAAAPIGLTDLGMIERPRYPKRQGWLAHLAYGQFTLEEITSGKAWDLLMWQETRGFV